MKKSLTVGLALLMLLSLAVPAFAAGDVAKSITVTGVALPVAGEKIPDNPLDDAVVKVSVATAGETALKEKSALASASWTEADNPNATLDTFRAGRSYRLTVTLEFKSENDMPSVNDETQFFVNKEAATHDSNEGQSITFYCDFVATPDDITPKVSLKVEGEKTREYDGKGITLTANVEKIDGIDYEYTWYREDQILEGKNTETVTVKNVSDSGEYYCKVSASLATDGGGGQTKSTKSSSHKITITPRVITVEIHDVEKNLFDPDPEFTYDILGEVYDDLTGSLSRLEGEDIGKYSILIGTLSFPEDIAENYEIRVEQGTLTIIDVGMLPFVTVGNIADQSYITGKSGAKIRVSATRGSIPENAILSLSLPSAESKEELEAGLSAKVMKSFTMSLVDETGKNLDLPRHASLKIQIPLAEEEEKFDPKTILAGIYSSDAASLETEVVETSSVTYITVQTDSLGTVALFEGELAKSGEKNPNGNENEMEKGGSLWMWILIIVLSLAAIGAIVFTVVQMKKNQTPKNSKKPAPKAPLTAEEQKEKEKARCIAEELNALPPIPEKKAENTPQVSEEGMKTRVVPLTGEKAPARAEAPAQAEAPAEKAEKDTPTQKAPRVISFEDLEE